MITDEDNFFKVHHREGDHEEMYSNTSMKSVITSCMHHTRMNPTKCMSTEPHRLQEMMTFSDEQRSKVTQMRRSTSYSCDDMENHMSLNSEFSFNTIITVGVTQLNPFSTTENTFDHDSTGNF